MVTEEMINIVDDLSHLKKAIQTDYKSQKQRQFFSKNSKAKAGKYILSRDLEDTIQQIQECVQVMVEENQQLREDKQTLELGSQVKMNTVDFLMAENNTLAATVQELNTKMAKYGVGFRESEKGHFNCPEYLSTSSQCDKFCRHRDNCKIAENEFSQKNEETKCRDMNELKQNNERMKHVIFSLKREHTRQSKKLESVMRDYNDLRRQMDTQSDDVITCTDNSDLEAMFKRLEVLRKPKWSLNA